MRRFSARIFLFRFFKHSDLWQNSADVMCAENPPTHDPDLGLPVRIPDGQEQAGESAGPASDAFAGLSSLAAGAQLPKRLGNCLYDASGARSYQTVQIHQDAGWLKSKFL